VLADEAKARVSGPDSLERLLAALRAFAGGPPPERTTNAARKYVQLLTLCDEHPVVVWLIAAGARWAFLARRAGDRLAFEPIDGVDRAAVLRLTAPT
jgi:hypothetical protein